MNKATYTYWQDEDMWLGYLNDFPDYLTQAPSLIDLEANLLDLYQDLTGGEIPFARCQGELTIA